MMPEINSSPVHVASTQRIAMLVPGWVNQTFDYLVPQSWNCAPGQLLHVPFGKKEVVGMVCGVSHETVPHHKLKQALSAVDFLPPLPETLQKFIEWVANYTLTPQAAVLKMVLSVPAALQTLLPPDERKRKTPLPQAVVPVLSAHQQAAAQWLEEKAASGFHVSVLDGVTGSGKTEVYFHLIETVLAQGKQALVLLPEISLSVQWVERFIRRFGFEPTLWHSGITPKQRAQRWQATALGRAKVVVGARSALFLPFATLGLVVVDEEHDGSYKQEDNVHYHARDMAVVRAQFEKIPCLLVSATPSLESWQNVQSGKYGHIALPTRFAAAQMPTIQLVDMRLQPPVRGQFLSPPLIQKLVENLAQGQQSLLFLNRRGYAPLTLCRACGHRITCPHCQAWLVLHRAQPRLMCHHCGYTMRLPKHCPACQAEDQLHPCGPGVEKIFEEATALFPNARIRVLSSDHTATPAAISEVINALESGECDIVVGTQMIAKGHHFPGLTLVGVVDADLGLAGGDLRAGERTYQLLQQISGRAGRAALAGTVLMQTYDPQHPVMQSLISGDRDAFLEMENQQRREHRMPPFARLAALILEGRTESRVQEAARAHSQSLQQLQKNAPHWFSGVTVLGPAPAPLYLLRGRYRMRFLLKSEKSSSLQPLLREWLARCPAPSSIRRVVDIDPYSFI